MLYIFYGRDSYSLRRALDELKAQLDSDGMLSTNTTLFDGRQVGLQELTAACDTVPFLGAHRLVIVEGLLRHLAPAPRARGRRSRKAGADEDRSDAWRGLADYAGRIPPTTTLVLIEESLPDAALVSDLRAKAQLREFAPLRPEAVAGWVQRRAREMGLALKPAVPRLLADRVGADLWTLSGELEKLAAYAGGNGRPVGEEDVRSLVAAVREVNVFALVDAVAEGRPAAALKLLRQMFDQGQSGAYVLAMLQRQYRHLTLAREMLDERAPSSRIGERLNLRGYALEKLLEQAPRYPLSRLRATYRRLVEADASIKRGIRDDELALELLVQELQGVR